jgi:hypothetical protein
MSVSDAIKLRVPRADARSLRHFPSDRAHSRIGAPGVIGVPGPGQSGAPLTMSIAIDSGYRSIAACRRGPFPVLHSRTSGVDRLAATHGFRTRLSDRSPCSANSSSLRSERVIEQPIDSTGSGRFRSSPLAVETENYLPPRRSNL